MARIAIAGFQHETNSFAPGRTDYDAFLRADSWPGLTRGEDILSVFDGVNLPIGGFIAEVATRHELSPILWAAATPGGLVTRDAYDRITAEIVDGIAALHGEKGLDAVYLDLHGAMVCEHEQDGEGALLRRLRLLLGPGVPIAASLDLHANITEEMFVYSDFLVAYRTYPHVDMAETGARAARALDAMFACGLKPQKAMRRMPFLIPVAAQTTDHSPAREIYALAAELEQGDVLSTSVGLGFHPADIAKCGPVVLAYGWNAATAHEAANTLRDYLQAHENDFDPAFRSPEEAVREAVAMEEGAGTVILADVQDNAGAGAGSDSTGLLHAALNLAQGRPVLAGLVCDPVMAARAHEAGADGVVEGVIGQAYGDYDPLEGPFEVLALSDGVFDCHGPFYAGIRANTGKTALLRRRNLTVAVSSRRMQAADQAIFRHLGVDPADFGMLILKSSAHFRADFSPLARAIINVASPAIFCDRPERNPYRNLRAGVRLGPGGPLSG